MRIGEVAAATGTTTKTLRFYEDKGLLPATDRTPGGYRVYAADVVSRLDFIRRGRTAGLTLAHIGQILAIRDNGEAPCRHVRDLLTTRLEVLDQQIADLQALRRSVAALREHAATTDPVTCPPERVCCYL